MKLGRGSPNTVAAMLEPWFAGLAPRLGVTSSDQPRGLPPALHQPMQAVWQVATEQATALVNASVAGEREQLAAERADVERDRQALAGQKSASQEREQLRQSALERAQRQQDELRAEMSHLREGLRSRDASLSQARESIARLVQEKDAAAADSSKRLDGLTAEISKIQLPAESTERRLLEEIDRARQETKAAQRALAEAERQLEAVKREAGLAAQRAIDEQHQRGLQVTSLTERLADSERGAAEFQALAERPHVSAPKTGRQPGKTSRGPQSRTSK